MDTIRVKNVLRRVYAAKEDEAPEQAAVRRRRYYYYNAPAEYSIKFTALKDMLSKNSPEQESTAKKLQGGNSGKYFADYFFWNKLVVVTNEYSAKSLVVYSCSLTPIGSKVAGSVKIFPSDTNVTADKIESDLLLFEDKRGNSSVINVDKTSESYYMEGTPPSNMDRILFSGAAPRGQYQNYEAFSRIYDEFRIWVPNLKQLLLPNFDTPRNDDVPGGHYVGGEQAYNKIAGDIELKGEEKKEETLGDKLKEDTSPFEPVGEKPVTPEKGEFFDKQSRDKGDYSSEPYSGGTDVMQRLVSDQAKNMKIRKSAIRVVEAHLNKSAIQSYSQPAQSGNNQSTVTLNVTDDPSNISKSKDFLNKWEKLHNEQKKIKNELDQQQKQMGTFQK